MKTIKHNQMPFSPVRLAEIKNLLMFSNGKAGFLMHSFESINEYPFLESNLSSNIC